MSHVQQRTVRALAMAAVMSMLASAVHAACPPKPNILLIVADDLGWTDLPFFNPPLNLNPPSGTTPLTPANFEVRQNPTVNRLDARIFANANGSLGSNGSFTVIPADASSTGHTYIEECGPACEGGDEHFDAIRGFGGLQRLAQNARFTRFYAASALCLSARAAIMTGRHAPRTGAISNEPITFDYYEKTIAEYLQDKTDYKTALIGKWHVGGKELIDTHRQPWTTRQGFDETISFYGSTSGFFKTTGIDCGRMSDTTHHFAECQSGQSANCCTAMSTTPGNGILSSPFLMNGSPTDMPGRQFCSEEEVGKEVPPGVGTYDISKTSECPFHVRVYGELAERYIDDYVAENPDHDPPFFLVVTVNAVHQAHKAPQRTNAHYGNHTGGKSNVKRPQRSGAYWALVEELDAAIGRILDKLDEKGLANETLVMFTSDQGQEGHQGYGNPNLRKGKFTVFEGGIRIPFLARACVADPRPTSKEPFGQVDLFRTIAEAAGIPPETTSQSPITESDKSFQLDGKSFYALLQGTGSPEKDFNFARLGSHLAAVMRVGEPVPRPPASDLVGICGGTDPLNRTTSCTPCSSNADCGAANTCKRVGKWCSQTKKPCMRAKDCNGGDDVCKKASDVDFSSLPTPCTCVLASWKVKTTQKNQLGQGFGNKGGLFELETNPGEDPDADCSRSENLPAASVSFVRDKLDRQVQWWNRCSECDCKTDCEGTPHACFTSDNSVPANCSTMRTRCGAHFSCPAN